MGNQALSQMAMQGVVPEGGLKLFNITAFMEDLLVKLGHKDVERFTITIKPQQPAGGAASGDNGAMAGRAQPQIGGGATPNAQQMMQQGGAGGL
jgi:hypothetical protein